MEPRREKVTNFICLPNFIELVGVKPAVVETSLKRVLVIFVDEGAIHDEAPTKDGRKNTSNVYLF
jgi:hypothetical protein